MIRCASIKITWTFGFLDTTSEEVNKSKKGRAGGDDSDHNRVGTFLPSGWKRHKDAHGRKYYEDGASWQTQWEKPPGNDGVAVAMVKNPMARGGGE